MDMDKLLIVEDEEFPAIARLIELGRQKSYITLDDILHFFPEAEQDVQQLEEAMQNIVQCHVRFLPPQFDQTCNCRKLFIFRDQQFFHIHQYFDLPYSKN